MIDLQEALDFGGELCLQISVARYGLRAFATWTFEQMVGVNSFSSSLWDEVGSGGHLAVFQRANWPPEPLTFISLGKSCRIITNIFLSCRACAGQ